MIDEKCALMLADSHTLKALPGGLDTPPEGMEAFRGAHEGWKRRCRGLGRTQDVGGGAVSHRRYTPRAVTRVRRRAKITRREGPYRSST